MKPARKRYQFNGDLSLARHATWTHQLKGQHYTKCPVYRREAIKRHVVVKGV